MNREDSGLKDVVGIGNAMVDILAHANEDFLATHNLVKGVMTLVDAEQGASIYEAMQSTVEMSGGSVGNTMAGLASLGAPGRTSARSETISLETSSTATYSPSALSFPPRQPSTALPRPAAW